MSDKYKLQQRIQKLEMKKYAEGVANKLSNFVNTFNFDAKSFVEHITYHTHRTLQQSIGKLVFMLIKEWAICYEKEIYDARNEGTCKACHDIIQKMKEESKYWDNLPII